MTTSTKNTTSGTGGAIATLTCLALTTLVMMSIQLTYDTKSRPLNSNTQHLSTRDEFESKSGKDLPPIETLIAPNGTIIGDISFLLDFAIIAFPKSGTTFMKEYLNLSDETWLHEKEFCIKNDNDLQRFINTYHRMHTELKQTTSGKGVKFGLKCPGVLYRNDIQIYRKYFRNTKLIIGLRHPVSWFESFYNYQIWRNITMPLTKELMGACTLHGKVCTDRARFHSALARLGLTDMETEEELALLFGRNEHENQTKPNNHSGRKAKGQMQLMKLPNPIFVYEVRQIHDKVISKQLSESIKQYLQFKEALPEIESYKQNKSRAINICNDQHSNVRKVLVKHGRDAADWIDTYFTKAPNVIAGHSESFHNLLEDWRADICEI